MKLPCYLVRDLLPLYKDEVCELETADDVKEHLDGCPDCRHLWETMQDTAPLEGDVVQAREQEQTAALRRVKSTQRKKRVLIAVAAVLATLCVVCLGLRLVYDYASNTYLDYDVDNILKLEYEEHPEEGENPWAGDGLYITLAPEAYSSLSWTCVLDTEEGNVLLFTLGCSLWHQWLGTTWYGGEADAYARGICTTGGYGRTTVENLTAAYYLPYSEFKIWVEQEKQELPEDAVLVWQRDAQ